MVDHLRDERVRLAEQHQFLSQVLHVSPSGVVILDFDRRVSSLNPAAERLLDRPRPTVVGRRLGRSGLAARRRARVARARRGARGRACSARGA